MGEGDWVKRASQRILAMTTVEELKKEIKFYEDQENDSWAGDDDGGAGDMMMAALRHQCYYRICELEKAEKEKK